MSRCRKNSISPAVVAIKRRSLGKSFHPMNMQNSDRVNVLTLTVIGVLCLWSCKSPSDSPDPNSKKESIPPGIFFDDFNYDDNSDEILKTFGWIIRSGGGGPGPSDCVWDPALVTFEDDTGAAKNRIMKLSAWTQGSGATCHQAEIFTSRKFQRATFAARILFTDVPESGGDGDGIVQTFFTISSWDLADTDGYSEFDFEYLPNGGWGRVGPHLWQTSWEKVGDSKSDQQAGSHAGNWRIFVIQTDGVETKYYVRDELRATHKEPYVVDGEMSINFNHWFISEGLRTQDRIRRQYSYSIDWVLARIDSMMSPAAVDSLVSDLRRKGYPRADSLVDE